MMAYFPRIIFYYFLQERGPISIYLKFSIRIGPEKLLGGNLMNNEVNECLRILIKVILRTGVEMLFNYGFFLLYSDYFFNIMPEQHIWFGYWLLPIIWDPYKHSATLSSFNSIARSSALSIDDVSVISNRKSQIDLPCNGKVSCYIDKPKSKTFVLLAMCSFSIITIVVSPSQIKDKNCYNLNFI